MGEIYCRHDRVASECPYCPLMRRKPVYPAAAPSALPDTDVADDDEGDDALLTASKRTRDGRASLDEWDADDSAADGIADLYQRGLRHNPRGTGEQDIISDDEQNTLGTL